MKFRKKPVVIEATQWNEGDDPLPCMVYRGDHIESDKSFKRYIIPTLEGDHIVSPGDWIITGVHGEHYPCKPDIFQKTYDAVDEKYQDCRVRECYECPKWNKIPPCTVEC